MTDGRQTLEDLLGDPMIQLVMERDRVRPEEVRWLLQRVRDRAEDPSLPPAYVVAKTCRRTWLCG